MLAIVTSASVISDNSFILGAIALMNSLFPRYKKQEKRRGFTPRLTLNPATYRKIPYGNCGNITPPFSRTSAAAFLFRNRLPIFFL